MKRILALALLLALLAALFSACAQSEPEKKPDDDQKGGNQTPVSAPSSESAEPSTESVVDFEPDPDPLPTEPPVETGELITDAISEEISTEDGYYSLHVPKINLDSADAQRVNQEIMDDFGATAQETLQMLFLINEILQFLLRNCRIGNRGKMQIKMNAGNPTHSLSPF